MKNRTAFSLLFLFAISAFAPCRNSAQEVSVVTRKVVTQVTPQYPALARTMRIAGVVKVDVLVAPNGTVKSLEVKGGHPMLAESAQNAVRQWKWAPAPHESHENVELRFTP